MSPWRSGAVIACVLVASAATAHAEPTESEVATARLLFSEGVKLEDAHEWVAALDRFRRVAAIKPTPQVRYNLGLCLAATGHLVEADNELGPVADLSGDADTLALASLAREALAKLRPRIPRLTVTLPAGASATTATVRLDGVAIHPALLGTPMLVDPGPHALVATTPTSSAEMNIVAVEGAKEPLLVALEFPVAPVKGGHHKIPTAAYVTGGVAAVSLGTALALGIARLAAVSSLNSECGTGGQFCPASAHGKVNLVDAETILADVFAGVGVASAGTAAILIQFAPIVPAASRGTGVSATVGGSF